MQSISVEQLAALTAPQLIDVREPDEFEAGHAFGAINMPLGSVEPAGLPDPAAPVYLICQAGGRSARAAQALSRVGVAAVNVEGGTSAWVLAGLPTEAGQ
ncbi:hypothetical protein BH11ACT2_BH11ACT2_01740 [soil metagenome]